tara:strand:+ start:7967 stop:9013 length:1047 start_codon:yes stop_codon:yes gene_type:complete
MTDLHPHDSLNLTLAVIASSSVPVLLLDGELSVIAASAAFYNAFGIDARTGATQQFAALGDGEWGGAQLTALLEATAAGMADVRGYELDLKRPGQGTRRLVISAQKLDYAEESEVRLLLTIADVTDARIADKVKAGLLQDNAILLQEVQHRVANSLQIIASILLQSARKVQSEETRTHLRSAHSRVMSIAAVQQQLATSSVQDVELRSYFEQLCKSLAASMISDPAQLSIIVKADKTITNANVSVSLGLVVTELVINALKHAFPDERKGTITVDYHTDKNDWTLVVSDDGIGMPENAAAAKPGLGTGIVEALSRNLEAELTVADAAPGTRITISHRDAAASTCPPQAA